jgi:hypothetical protein
MAYLEQCRSVVDGRGRVTWGIDLAKWDPALPDSKQSHELWLATWAENGVRGTVIYARAQDGKEALRLLLLALIERYGHPQPKPAN